MVRKLLIKAFGLKDYMKNKQEEEIFPKPHYVRCCSEEEHRQVKAERKNLEKKAEKG